MTKENEEKKPTNEEKKRQKAKSVSEGSKNETYYESFELIGRKANRNYKDTLFRFIFSDKEKLLGLYNALNNSSYTDTTELSILVGAPKVGKSFFVLGLCLAVAKGEPFLGFPTMQGDVLYMSLEDTEDRLQNRLMLLSDDGPESLVF